ncbi:RraA family protein [Mesorhizobium sp. WSM2239]|uniref:Putative 4-hydroxy-4-methyl-2-oxoglutarate aldolase n=2 Tax=unclassified Mesorhizobium TaxID=325217 RepID=A0AAU8DG45_9HYPH
MSLAARLAALGTATIGEASPSARIIGLPLRPLAPEMAAAGPALTAACRPGDNLALHRAIAAAAAGDVLVVDYGGSTDSGPFGEIMALACRLRGIAALVTDGSVRDSARLIEMGFPVFARGANIRGTTKRDRGKIGEPITLGGVRIERGDLVVADADAVIVLPAGDAEAALAAGEARAAAEERMMERLRAGETTLQILGLTEGDEP